MQKKKRFSALLVGRENQCFAENFEVFCLVSRSQLRNEELGLAKKAEY
jgi:hypothetical protein